MRNPLTCKHKQFWAECKVQGDEAGERFAMMVKVKCSECNTPFAFPGNMETIIIQITPGILPQRNRLALAVDNMAARKHENTPEHPGETPAA